MTAKPVDRVATATIDTAPEFSCFRGLSSYFEERDRVSLAHRFAAQHVMSSGTCRADDGDTLPLIDGTTIEGGKRRRPVNSIKRAERDQLEGHQPFVVSLTTGIRMVLVCLSLAIVVLSTACAVLSAMGRVPLWIAVLLWCIAALTSAVPMHAVTGP